MPQRPPTLGFRPPTPAIRPRERRPSSTSRGYGIRWQRVARQHLAQHPLCVRCLTIGCPTPAQLVDHIIPIHGEADPRFYDPDNHQALCRRCHAVKTHADRRAGLTRTS